jgi:transcriptional regulator with XRE-family HTH domain
MDIGECLREMRHELGLSQGQMEIRTGIKRPALSRYETGRVAPSLRVLRDLCVHGFGIKLSELFGWLEAQEASGRSRGKVA